MLVVLGFIFSTIATGVVTYAVGVYSADHQARVTERNVQINRVIDAASAFDPLAVKFVAETNKDAITQPTREAIKNNLIAQRSALENTRGLLSPADQAISDRYTQVLGDANDGLKKATGKMDSRQFMQASVHIAELRPKLYEALRN